MPVRVAISSNSQWVNSGYGTQTATWVRRFPSLGHEVAVLSYCGLHGAPLTHEGTMVYPGSTEDAWAQDVMLGHYRHFGADLLITLMDAWVLDPHKLAGMNVAHWMPVDCSPLSWGDRRVLDMGGGQPVAMSRFGERQLTGAGYSPLYVPHGIDTGLFRPLDPALREQIREQAGFASKFVIGINAANQDPVRKGFGEQFAAFAAFHEQHPDSVLLVHSRTQTRNGTNLERLRDDLGLGGVVEFASQYMYAAGFTPASDIARWCGVLDVLSNCSYGEGFGLALVEAQATGTPVVTTDAASMTELCGSGWLVEVDPLDDMYFNRGHDAWWFRPRPRKILAAYEQAYACWVNDEMRPWREKARQFALTYDADKVLIDYWKPCLNELEQRL